MEFKNLSAYHGIPFIKDGAAGVRNVNQFCICRRVINRGSEIAEYYNPSTKTWGAFGEVLTFEQANRERKKLHRKMFREPKLPVKLTVQYNQDNGFYYCWTVIAEAKGFGIVVDYFKKPTAKQLRQLRNAMATVRCSKRPLRLTYCKKKGKLV